MGVLPRRKNPIMLSFDRLRCKFQNGVAASRGSVRNWIPKKRRTSIASSFLSQRQKTENKGSSSSRLTTTTVTFVFSLRVLLDELTQDGGLEEFEKVVREQLDMELKKLRAVRWSGEGTMAKAPEKSNGMAAPASNSKCEEDEP